ncbi:MAG: IS3 family transposase [Nitrospirota bacterium]
MKRTRRNHGAPFKAQVALAAVNGDRTLAELSEQCHVHPTQVTEWKQPLRARAADGFGETKSTSATPDLKTLPAKIGQLALEKDFGSTRAHQGGMAERNAMIDRTHKLPVVRHCPLLELSRATAYDQGTPVSATDQARMRRIDALHLDDRFAGARRLRALLRLEGHTSGRKRVRPLMTRMEIAAGYRKPRTSQRHPAHTVSPDLLCQLEITCPNHVWPAESTYIPMKRGFVYVFAVLDWASRRVLAWRLSNTLTTDFCLDAVQEAITQYGPPAIFNTDQGCQFTSQEFTGLLKDHGIQISMDGKGCWRDNVCVERRWKSIKYEEVDRHTYETVSAAQQGFARYLTGDNQTRPHRALDGHIPNGV